MKKMSELLIYHNHINKNIMVNFGIYLLIHMTLKKKHAAWIWSSDFNIQDALGSWMEDKILAQLIFAIERVMLNKRFEKEADLFACKQADRPEGMIDAMRLFQQYQNQYDADFDRVYKEWSDKSSNIGLLGNSLLFLQYYIAKGYHVYEKAWRWIYVNTPYGEHPSCQERIDAAKQYLALSGSRKLESIQEL